MPQIQVEVDADGNVKVEAKGVVGQGCAALTRALEESLGRTRADVKKSEFYQQAKAHEHKHAGH